MSGARDELRRLLGAEARVEPLARGLAGEVLAVRAADGRELVAKTSARDDAGLAVEADMLRFVAGATDLPFPRVHHVSPRVLLLDRLPGRAGCEPAAETHAAELVARLHQVPGPRFGFEFDTRIGGLVQENPWRDSWLAFFAEARLGAMARAAFDEGALGRAELARVEHLAGRLERWLPEPERPALLHGDLWSGNLLSQAGRVTGLLDPALCFGHPELELAFTTLFSTFGRTFYEAYGARARPLDRDFFDVRRHVYNVYPLLVHVRLFGGGYRARLDEILARFA